MSRRAPPSPAIRSFQLFGESARLADVLHCETIPVRSALHGWELAAHRHPALHQVLLVQQGGGRARLEEDSVPLAAAALVNVPTGRVHAFSFDRGTQGWVLTLADDLVEALLGPSPQARQTLARPATLALPAGPAAAIADLLERIREEYGRHDGPTAARGLVLRGLAGAVLGLAARALEDDRAAGAPGAPNRVLRRFEALLDQHVDARWRVADFARALAVTPTHLSRISRAATGLPASRLIEARLMREARRQLLYTPTAVATIADTLGFGDPAYFSRVFARHCGASPRHYRLAMTRKP